MVEVGGVGLLVRVSPTTAGGCPPRGPRSPSRRTWSCARMRSTSTASPRAAERELFEAFISVSGVGPRLALAICGARTRPTRCGWPWPAATRPRLQAAPAAWASARPSAWCWSCATGSAPRSTAPARRRRRRTVRTPSSTAREGLVGARLPARGGRGRPGRRPGDGSMRSALVRHGLWPPARGRERGAPGAARAPEARPRSELDRSLRPRTLADFVGPGGRQAAAARSSSRPPPSASEALDHVLLAGPPGLGKTSPRRASWPPSSGVGFHVDQRARARAQGRPRRRAHGARVRTTCSSSTRSTASTGSIEEVLYPAMEDFQIDVVLGQGPSARTLRLDLPPFTLVGATTRTGLLTTPAARPLRRVAPPRATTAPDDLGGHRTPLGRPARRSSCRPEGAAAHRRALARHTAHRQPAAAPGARRRPGARSPGGRPRGGRGGPGAARGRRPRARRAGPPDPAPPGGDLRGRARSASARWPTAWGRPPTRSRTSTSPTCSRRACSSARRAGGWPPPGPSATSASSRRRSGPPGLF